MPALLLTATRRYRLMSEWARGAARGLTVAAMALAGGSSWAANAEVAVSVTAVPETVSLSRTGLQNYGAIQVTITPTQNNVINQLVFTSSAKIAPNLTAAVFKESIPAGACVPSGSDVKCTQGQARGGDVLSYIIIYDSPLAGSSFQYDWTFTYSTQGSAGSNSSTLNSSSGSTSATLTETDSPTQRKNLKTFVPALGGTFFTGIRSATSPAGTDSGDPSTTTLVLPPGLGLKVPATVVEDDGAVGSGGQTNDTLTTLNTTISIPTTVFFSTPITSVLQRDVSTIKTKTQHAADRVPLYYTADTGEPWQPGALYPLKNCTDLVGGGPISTDAVCVAQRIYVKNNMVGSPKPGGGTYSALDVGDFLFVIKALQNGRFSW
ncbi:MAG: hypothetical protein KIT60_02815 [Burkholderiaceae bacterium]|nr:hypothetical protein [Burkholderiaceae bacterium]